MQGFLRLEQFGASPSETDSNMGKPKADPEQKRQRGNVERGLFNHFEPGGSKCMTDVTGEDETWVPFYGTF